MARPVAYANGRAGGSFTRAILSRASDIKAKIEANGGIPKLHPDDKREFAMKAVDLYGGVTHGYRDAIIAQLTKWL